MYICYPVYIISLPSIANIHFETLPFLFIRPQPLHSMPETYNCPDTETACIYNVLGFIDVYCTCSGNSSGICYQLLPLSVDICHSISEFVYFFVTINIYSPDPVICKHTGILLASVSPHSSDHFSGYHSMP
jgi:hypothetical protein